MYLTFVGMNDKVLSHKIVTKDVETVKMLSHGKSIKQICAETGDNEKTLEMRMYRLRKNLGLHSSSHLVSFFLRNKIIE